MEGKVRKTARKRSMDPAQEHLREQKHVWSKATSNFITRLIAFKRVLNGQRDQRVPLEPVKIQFPLPEGTGSVLNQLATEFEAIIGGWNSIIDEQKRYSGARRKPQEHAPPTAAPANQNQPQQQMAAADDGLAAEASWWGSRFMAKMPIVGLTGKDAKYLKVMINEAVTMEDQLKEMENALTSSSINSIADAWLPLSYMVSGSLDVFANSWRRLVRSHGKVLAAPDNPKYLPAPVGPQQPLPQPPSADPVSQTSQDPVAEQSAEVEPPPEFTEDVVNVYRADSINMKEVYRFLERENLAPKTSDMRKYKKIVENIAVISLLLRNPNRTPEAEQEIKSSISSYLTAYQILLDVAKMALNNQGAQRFSDLLPFIKKPEVKSSIKEELVKEAANPFSRMMKRWWLNNKPHLLQDKRFHGKKVETVQAIFQSIADLDKVMDALETKGNNIDDISKVMSDLSKSLVLVFESMLQLVDIHNTMFVEESFNAKRPNRLIHRIPELSKRKLEKGMYKAMSIYGVPSIPKQTVVD